MKCVYCENKISFANKIILSMHWFSDDIECPQCHCVMKPTWLSRIIFGVLYFIFMMSLMFFVSIDSVTVTDFIIGFLIITTFCFVIRPLIFRYEKRHISSS